MKFYLGTHMPHWLALPDMPPLFVSHRRLRNRRTMPTARTDWALDSGGFTELSMFGHWQTTPNEYVAAVERYRAEIGRLDWAAPQDWMCEPWIVAKTGLTVREHQWRTVQSYLDLRDSGPFVPVLQGWTLADYLRHVDMYTDVGVDLTAERTVGLGSVCRRQATEEIGGIVARLSAEGLRLHGFGVKGDGIRRYGWALTSADSMAWSAAGRRVRPCSHCRTGRQPVSCANCLPFALEWRRRFMADGGRRPVQLGLAL